MPSSSDPYDEVPYRGGPVEWAAPERLAVTSLLHGGPRARLDGYRVLELGCADGANLVPLAYYRRHGAFVGVEGSMQQVEVARARAAALELTNLQIVHTDFLAASSHLEGHFDYVIAHGVLSWISDEVRDAVLQLCAEHLGPGGLLYVNYNSLPGWSLRGMVRDFVLAQTERVDDLLERGRQAQEVAAAMAALFETADHPYSKVMATEFRLVCDQEISYVIHDYLEENNRAYWRSEFLSLAGGFGFEYVADADFNYPAARVDKSMAPWLTEEGITGTTVQDTIDLLIYRQLHSPILTRAPWSRAEPSTQEVGELVVASSMKPQDPQPGEPARFRHPSGQEVTASGEAMRDALTELYPLWPRGRRVRTILSDVEEARDDLELLHRERLIELRCVEPGDFDVGDQINRLNAIEARDGGPITTVYHTQTKPKDH